jgi:threonine dehydrogenase-like Zn-dependent dehydrogenase
LQIAKLLGATTTIAIGRTAEKLQMAQERYGANATVNLTREKLTIRYLTIDLIIMRVNGR